MSQEDLSKQKVTPGRCFVGALVSGALSIAFFGMLRAIVAVFANKPVDFSNPIVINISIAVRTLVVGITALGGGIFGIVALGLTLLGIQLIFQKFTTKQE